MSPQQIIAAHLVLAAWERVARSAPHFTMADRLALLGRQEGDLRETTAALVRFAERLLPKEDAK